MAATTWEVECNRYFIETEQRTKKGKPVMVPVTVRKMHIRGEFIVTDQYEVVLVKRKGQQYYSVKMVVPPVKPKWTQLVTLVKPVEIKWKREGSYTEDQFKDWLARILGKSVADFALSAMLLAEPENLAA
jgi:hypothetical protein